MKKAFGSLARLGLGVVLLALGAGCEAQDCDVVEQTPDGGTETREGVCLKSLTRFDGTNEFVHTARWLPGAPITIDGRNGDIEVVQGTGTDVVATFDPFVWLAHDSSQDRVQAQFDKLNTEATGDPGGSGAVLVRSSRDDGASSGLGADIRVEIPPGFDGALTIEQDNGQTDIDFAGSASAVKLISDNGSCSVTSSAVASSVELFCKNGDISANISGAPAGTGPRTIHTGLGDINLSFVGVPTSQPFSVQAFAPDGVVNTVNEAGAGCVVMDPAAPNSKTIRCRNGTSADPVFRVDADSLSDITLTF
jgi:hypothetical protein